jgi:hypothetical protein
VRIPIENQSSDDEHPLTIHDSPEHNAPQYPSFGP